MGPDRGFCRRLALMAGVGFAANAKVSSLLPWAASGPSEAIGVRMKIRTSRVIRASCERLWPLLTNSQMTAPGCFCLGIPRPVACELPEAEGRVGAERRCVSDRGTVTQVITEWQPPYRLRFRMVSTDHAWGRCVDSIEEEFILEQGPGGTRMTRVTTFAARGFLRLFKEALFYVGLKRVHLFVFKNWRDQAEPTRGSEKAADPAWAGSPSER